MTSAERRPGALYLFARRVVIALGAEVPARAVVHATRRTRTRLVETARRRASRGSGAHDGAGSNGASTEFSAAELRAMKRDVIDNEHLRLLIAFALKEDSNCVDVGAHHGACLAEIVRCAPQGRHIAYEPLPDMAAFLRSQFLNVEVREAALSNEEGDSTFVYVPDAPAYSGLRERTYPRELERRTLTVHTERLDEHLPPDYRLDLIKIDVEGAEMLVLEGALGVIKRDQPIVVFEHGPGGADRYGFSPAQVFDLLTQAAGMRIFDLDGNGPYSRSDFEAEFIRGERWNYVARP